MNLVFHLFLHVLTALVAGFVVWRFWREPLFSFGAAFFGGVLIDLDHLIDYFIAFGLRFDMLSFIHGEQFAKNDKIYALFHGWEYVILLLGLAWLVKSDAKLKVAVSALSLGVFFHLLIDVNVNHGMTVRSYSIAYRTFHHYEMKAVVTPEHYREHLLKNK